MSYPPVIITRQVDEAAPGSRECAVFYPSQWDNKKTTYQRYYSTNGIDVGTSTEFYHISQLGVNHDIIMTQ